MKRKGQIYKKGLALGLACTLAVPALTMPVGSVQAADEAWVATPYTREDGTIVEGLEDAVNGKRHWLETTEELPARASVQDGVLTVSNGVITREFKIPETGGTDFATTRYYNEYLEKELLEDEVKPDLYIGLYDEEYDDIYDDSGIKVTQDPIASLDNKLYIPDGAIKIDPDYYYVGGTGTTENTFVFDGYEIKEECEVPFEWTPNERYGDPTAGEWPPKGVHIEFNFSAPETFPEVYQGVQIKVIYEMFDNIPAMKKRVEVTNNGEQQIMIGRMAPEVLNGNENMDELLLLENSYLCGDQSALPVGRDLPCRCDLEKDNSPFKGLTNLNHTCYDVGPAYDLAKDQTFVSFDTYEMIYSTYWFELQMRERMGMYRNLFPWITDNPLTFHNTGALTKQAIDHAAEAGFDMIIQSYSAPDESGQMLSKNQAILDKYKELVDYAHSKNIDIGIYQAQYTRGQYKGDYTYGKNDVGQWGTWCVASAAFDDYWDNFKYFVKYTGLDCVEIDGTYPGTYCNHGHDHLNQDKETDPDPKGTDKQTGDASKYAVHQGFFDSNVKQWENAVRMVCSTFRDMGVYIKVPAWYYVNGANKCGIGYEEAAWSQPRHEQLIYGRQIMHNASYARSMSMSWSHVPFANYHGGGGAAAFQPFKDHMEDYNWVMAQYLGNGVASDFRGTALFDAETQNICNKWVEFYHRYRGIVNSDMVHISQATYDESDRTRGVKMDTLYHVNAKNPGEKGLLWVYNQSDEERTEVITVPMYYTGLTNLSYPTAPLKDSMGKDVHRYGAYPPNYKWLPQEEGNYRLPDATGETTGAATFVNEGVKAQNVTIDSNGNAQITVTLKPMSFTYYTIYEEGQQPDVDLEIGKVQNVKAGAVTENSVELTWDKDVTIKMIENGVVNDNPAITVEYYNVYRDGEFVARTMTNSYADTKLKESTAYNYSVEAVISEIPGEKSDALSVTTSADNVKPQIVSVSADKTNGVLVRFTEPVDKATAEDTANYILNNGKKVTSAKVEDETNVRLTVDELDALTNYQLEVKNIKDISKAGNVLDTVTTNVIYGYVAKYALDSLADGTVIDYFGNHNGKIYNVEEAALAYGKGAKFTASKAGYADLGSELLNGLDTYSVNMWIQPNGSGKQVLLSQGQDEIAEDDFTIYLEDGILKFHASNSNGKEVSLASKEKVEANEWSMATVVRDGNQFSLALNGEVADTDTVQDFGTIENKNAMYLGAIRNHAGGDRTLFYDGVIDEVALYQVALRGAQMEELFGSYAVKHASLLAQAKAISGEYYTADSFTTLASAIAELEKCMTEGTDPAQTIEAAKALETALQGLTKKDAYKSLEAVFHMDEADGNVIYESVSGKNAVLTNGDYLRYGTPFGKGVYLTVTKKDMITIPAMPVKDQEEYSISGWFKSQARPNEVEKVGKQVLLSDEGGHVVLSLQNNKLVLDLNNGTGSVAETASKEIATDTVTGGEVRTAWNHFALTKKGSEFVLYQNGEEVLKASLNNVAMDAPVYIGAETNGFNGLVNEFAFYGKALTKGETEELTAALPFDKGSEENIALNKTLMSDGMSDPYRLNDGKVLDFLDPGTPWTARSNGTTNTCLKYGFDLGAEFSIKALSLTQFFRAFGDNDIRRFRDVVIQVSTTSDFSSGVTTVFNTDADNSLGYGVGTDNTYFSFELGYDIVLDAPVTGRYVRLLNSGFIDKNGNYSGYVNVSELEVYADTDVKIDAELSVAREEAAMNVVGDREYIRVETDAMSSAANVTATSSADNVATVTNQNGILMIQAVGAGNAVITVQHPTDEALTKEIKVEVKDLEPTAVVDDKDASIKYDGSITLYDQGRGSYEGIYEYDRSIHYSTHAGDYAEYKFTGTGIDVITTVNVDQGESEIYIDGELIEKINTKTPNEKYPKRSNQICVFSKTDLPYGEHTIKQVNVSGNMTIDAFRVYNNINKSGLEELYNKYKDEEKTGYVQETWSKFEKALENAKAVLDNPEADQETIDAAVTELQAAADGLRVSKTILERCLNEAKQHVADGEVDGLVESIKKLFADAIAEGETVMAKENATKEEVANTTTKLILAIQALDMKAGDKTDLAMALELADMIDLKNYVEAGQDAFLAAVNDARTVWADGDAFQEDVDAAWRALAEAIGNLRMKADKKVLEDLLNSVEELDLGLYTEESVKGFQAALASAKAVLTDETLSKDDQKVVDDAVKALAEAKDALVAKADKKDGNTDANSGKDNTAGSDKKDNSGSPKTGDNTSMMLVLMLAFVSGAFVLVFRRRKLNR